MKILYSGIFIFMVTGGLHAQSVISGTVVDRQSGEPLPGIRVYMADSGEATFTEADGSFTITGIESGSHLLIATALGYNTLQMALNLGSGPLQLGAVYMERERPETETEPIINIEDTEFGEEGGVQTGYTLLQAGRDVFLNRVAFDFGQAFFRARGYDSRETRVLLNGFVMNSPLDGRPQWNYWGGLNDVVRNQEISYGLMHADTDFGGLLGSTLIDTRPSGLRPGWRLSASVSNRSYRGRIMATYVSRSDSGGWAYTVSASRRWAREGYIRGTLYDAWAVFGSLEYQFDERQSLALTGIISSNRRGRSSALTKEVKELAGPRYNPYWGWQDGEMRNSRERLMRAANALINYRYQGEKSALLLGAGYFAGTQNNSRLGYYNAPNPDPVYYRYLPSYAVNNPGGPNFPGARIAEEAFLRSSQINWEALYRANSEEGNQGNTAYMLYDDVADNSQLQFLLLYDLELSQRLRFNTGIRFTAMREDNYSRIRDLLGAQYHEDTDPFSETVNDLEGPLNKREGEIFGYSYRVLADVLEPYVQGRFIGKNWEANAAAWYTRTTYRRYGNFINARYPDASGGMGTPVTFSGPGVKGGLQYHIGGKHWFSFQGAAGQRAPLLRHTYINPREFAAIVPNIPKERFSGMEFRYDLRSPGLNGRFGLYYTRFMDLTDINYFFTDSGLGSDFVQEVVSGLDQLHAGIELGLEYEFTPNLKVSAVVAAGKYRYASDPLGALYFDTAGKSEDLINTVGRQALGPAALRGEALSAGPQTALSFGLEYRDPKYWWVAATANFLGGCYTSPSVLARTAAFRLDPENGVENPRATPERVDGLLSRKPIEGVYLLNLACGKSWLKNGLYVGIFASMSNVFNLVYQSGGYEQSRNGNYGQWEADQLSGLPSFGAKYWYGYGRTFFLNIAIGF